MPQLNPAPWLAIFLLTWLVFTVIIPPKVLSHQPINEPNLQSTKNLKPMSWNWLWH